MTDLTLDPVRAFCTGYDILSARPQVSTIKPDNFEPKIISQTDDYLYAEFQSPTFGFIDDVCPLFEHGIRSGFGAVLMTWLSHSAQLPG